MRTGMQLILNAAVTGAITVCEGVDLAEIVMREQVDENDQGQWLSVAEEVEAALEVIALALAAMRERDAINERGGEVPARIEIKAEMFEAIYDSLCVVAESERFERKPKAPKWKN